MKHTILIVEDNVDTAKNIQLFLEHHGMTCLVSYSGAEGIEAFVSGKFDLVMLDIMLPDGDGFYVCEQIRQYSDVPIIMLTAKVSDDDLTKGLAIGADDYIRKPYSNKEMVARVKAHLRRHVKNEELLIVGPYQHNIANQSISVDGKELALTRTECKLLVQLLSSPARVFSREQLFLLVFEDTHESFERTIDVHLHNIRKKVTQTGLEVHGIKSVYGIGYKLEI